MSIELHKGLQLLNSIIEAETEQKSRMRKVTHVGLSEAEEAIICEYFLRGNHKEHFLYLKEMRSLMGYPVIRTKELSIGVKVEYKII